MIEMLSKQISSNVSNMMKQSNGGGGGITDEYVKAAIEKLEKENHEKNQLVEQLKL